MKLHPNVVSGAVECLKTIFQEKKYTDDVLEKSFRKHPQWGSRDRRFVAESVYECVRWHRFFAEIAICLEDDSLFFEKLLFVYLVQNQIAIPKWYAETGLETEKINLRLTDHSFPRKICESVPDWLDELALEELGEERWSNELHALNNPAQVVLRANTLKTTVANLKTKLEEEQVETAFISYFPDALTLTKRTNLRNHDYYKKGFFEIQDAGSQAIAPFLQAEPGMYVIDACAGGGGKTLHLAALMQNKGHIVALDVEEKKLTNLETRAKRADATIVESCLISDANIARLYQKADRLLLDVPCTGLGVLKRNPDAKWKLSIKEIDRVRKIQQSILENYPSMLKKKGIMVYATCSILPSENSNQVRRFLENHPKDFDLLEEKQIWPSEGQDGFYMARIQKK